MHLWKHALGSGCMKCLNGSIDTRTNNHLSTTIGPAVKNYFDGKLNINALDCLDAVREKKDYLYAWLHIELYSTCCIQSISHVQLCIPREY